MLDCGEGLAHIATITSRPHALVVATLLEAEGIPVWIDGEWHASADPLSVALGGHRLTIPVSEWHRASELIAEVGLPCAEVAYEGGRQAILRFLAVCYGPLVFLGIPAAIAGIVSATVLALVPISAITTPVDPRGRNDWLLAPVAD
ncbi:MAG: hypothetical protein WBA68_05970 [Alteraurantiacibacter sp.]